MNYVDYLPIADLHDPMTPSEIHEHPSGGRIWATLKALHDDLEKDMFEMPEIDLVVTIEHGQLTYELYGEDGYDWDNLDHSLDKLFQHLNVIAKPNLPVD